MVADLKTIDLLWKSFYLSEVYLLIMGSRKGLFLSEEAMASWDILGLSLVSLVLKFNYLRIGLMFLALRFLEDLERSPPLR